MRISDWSSDVCSSDLSTTANSPIASSIARRSATIRSRVGSARARKISSSSVMTWDIKLSLYPVNGAPPPFFPPLAATKCPERDELRSEEHTSELQSLMRISYAVFCLKKKMKKKTELNQTSTRVSLMKT